MSIIVLMSAIFLYIIYTIMIFDLLSLNGNIIPTKDANIPFTETEVEYGFGVYETIKQRAGVLYFIDKHIDRLFYSARCIGLKHDLKPDQIKKWIIEIVDSPSDNSCNLKVVLQGRKSGADLIIIPSSPYFPRKEWYRDGVSLCTFEYERFLPQAKTLNMLPSYIFYKKAVERNCYDGLYIDKQRNILEGSRTNFFAIINKNIFSPPKEKILEGVTLLSMMEILSNIGYQIRFREINIDSLSNYDSIFITSTSSKILPVSRIDADQYKISQELKDLIKYYDLALAGSKGKFDHLLDFAKSL